MSGPATPSHPSLPWRLGSVAVMGSVGAISRGFLYAFNSVEVTGLSNLLGVLDRRKSQPKERGLLTVCNHVAVVDDPLIWGILPLRYAFDVENLRWGLGAHDICFTNSFTSTFFSLGQVLPTHRLWHSPQGGLYQPTIAQAVKLLSDPGLLKTPAELTFSTNGTDRFPSPAAYSANRHAWVHVFPEACCHQNKENSLRYFKWGVSRLILESEPAPEFIPMFIHGTQDIMPEERGFPRFLPRVGNRVRVVIGEPTDADRLFGRYRAAWRKLVENTADPEHLRTGPEAVQLRIDVARAVRDEVQKLRLSLGFPAEKDDSAALAETWANEPNIKKFKSSVDGSLVNRR
ncbi:Lysophosphatidylcholine acyltransferase [Escovopsis weberi]|uniref:Tafazzin family protein n=1 Tax=Escovopsis weberi TaxID=150374 RepID=A0A0M8MWS2_ESCWE|nr:Lysophosphatidylcholine acyltransferase [Escovopsis weberi]